MAGLQRLLKIYGQMQFKGSNGKVVTWIWDYAKDEPRIKSEMTKEEIAESEKAKWMLLKDQIQDGQSR